MFLNLIRFLRINQWYKNLVVFLAVVFSGNLFDVHLLAISIAGFFVMCAVSSANYIVNDIVDRREDMLHPEKSKRMIASGRIKVWTASVAAAALFFLSLMCSAALSYRFFWTVVFLFGFTMLYSFVLKKIIFADMTAIGINFIARAVAGALIIGVWISPYLIAIPFFFALFLSAGKRYSDLVFSGQGIYSRPALKAISWMFFALLIGSFFVYCVAVHPLLLAATPFVAYSLARYQLLVFSGSRIARKTEFVFADFRLLISLIAFGLIVLAVLY